MGLLDLLRKREADREMSAHEYVTEAIRLEASDKVDKVDVGKLEGHLVAVGMTADGFAAAVDRTREINRLRSIIAGKQEATERHRELGQQAKTIRANNTAEIQRLNDESDAAEKRIGSPKTFP